MSEVVPSALSTRVPPRNRLAALSAERLSAVRVMHRCRTARVEVRIWVWDARPGDDVQVGAADVDFGSAAAVGRCGLEGPGEFEARAQGWRISRPASMASAGTAVPAWAASAAKVWLPEVIAIWDSLRITAWD